MDILFEPPAETQQIVDQGDGAVDESNNGKLEANGASSAPEKSNKFHQTVNQDAGADGAFSTTTESLNEIHQIVDQSVDQCAGAVASLENVSLEESKKPNEIHGMFTQDAGDVGVADLELKANSSGELRQMEEISASLNGATDYYSDDSEVVEVAAYFIYDAEA